MVRALNIAFILAVVFGAAVVYDVKLAANESAERMAALQDQIDEEKDRIRHLRAEWSLLNKPERLQTLVERYNDELQLKPMDPQQIVSPELLPARPTNAEPIGNRRLGGFAGAPLFIR